MPETEPQTEQPGPLQGVKILDLTSMISGPIATMMLADQGADVIKVEPLTGDLVRYLGPRRGELTSTFISANRSKRSLAINLKTDAGIEALKRLVKGADVFVQNFRPGAIERMGLSEAVIRDIRENIIYVSISGFGETGPYANKRVYDPVIQALSGLAAIQSDRETGRPRMVRTIIPDKTTAITAAQAITAALFSRERTGEGQHVKLAMLDTMVAYLWPEGMTGFTFVGREVSAARAQLAQDLIFETTDGYITAGAVSDSEWSGMCKAFDREEWLEDSRFNTAAGRVAHAEIRLSMVADVVIHKSSAYWLEHLDAQGVPCAPVLSRQEVLSHEQILENDIIQEYEDPVAGTYRQPRPAARFSRTPAVVRSHAPQLGQNSIAILKEGQFTDEEISQLKSDGVIGTS